MRIFRESLIKTHPECHGAALKLIAENITPTIGAEIQKNCTQPGGNAQYVLIVLNVKGYSRNCGHPRCWDQVQGIC